MQKKKIQIISVGTSSSRRWNTTAPPEVWIIYSDALPKSTARKGGDRVPSQWRRLPNTTSARKSTSISTVTNHIDNAYPDTM